VVESGEKNGPHVRFPTANIHLNDLIPPAPRRLYAVPRAAEGEDAWRDGVARFRAHAHDRFALTRCWKRHFPDFDQISTAK